MRKPHLPVVLIAGAVCLFGSWAAAQSSISPTPPPAPGSVVWFDLLTEDGEAVKGFYESLFGWETIQHRDGGWVVFHHGRLIAAISEIDEIDTDLDEGFWLAGIAVNDIDDTIARARKLGGKIDLGPDTVPGFARYAVIVDLEDAPLLVVDPLIGLGDTEERHGAFVWTELWSQDPSEAAAFYREVLGYERRQIDVEGRPYIAFDIAGEHRAGLVQAPTETIEPAWVPYIGVDEMPSILERVAKLGGRVIVEPHPDFVGGAAALVTDPLGAAFFVYELDETGEVSE